MYLQNWSHVLSYVNKAEATPDYSEIHSKEANQTILTRLKCAAGLAELATKKYKSAAKHFLQANFDHCDFPELLSPSNVAVYGGLCALATFDRNDLQKNVIVSRYVQKFFLTFLFVPNYCPIKFFFAVLLNFFWNWNHS